MRLDLSRDRLLLLVASLALMAPLLRFYWPAGEGLDVVGYPLGRDFINVWSGPQVAFGDKVSTIKYPDGSKLYGYRDRRLSVLVDKHGDVTSLGVY